MILCERFVFIHFPKTGGTFVSAVLQELLGKLGQPYEEADKHGLVSSIPKEYTGVPIVACVRNPFDLKVSVYRFGWWRTNTVGNDLALARAKWPRFPDIAFSEFVEWWDTMSPTPLAAAAVNPFASSVGRASLRFVEYFSRDPRVAWSDLSEESIARGSYRKHLAPVHFLRMERLNTDLVDYLASVGYERRELGFIADMPLMLPPEGGRGGSDPWEQHYTPELLRAVGHRERLLLQLFPEYRIS